MLGVRLQGSGGLGFIVVQGLGVHALGVRFEGLAVFCLSRSFLPAGVG